MPGPCCGEGVDPQNWDCCSNLNLMSLFMKRITLIPVALAFSFLVSPIRSNAAEDPIASEVLLQASQSWKGDIYKYPEGTPLITVKMVVFQPGPNQNHTPMTCLVRHLSKKVSFCVRYLLQG